MILINFLISLKRSVFRKSSLPDISLIKYNTQLKHKNYSRSNKVISQWVECMLQQKRVVRQRIHKFLKLVFFLSYICAQRNFQRIYFHFTLNWIDLWFSDFRRLRNSFWRWFCGWYLNSFLKISKLIIFLFFFWRLICPLVLLLSYEFSLFLLQRLRLGDNFFLFLFLFMNFFLSYLVYLFQMIILLYFHSL